MTKLELNINYAKNNSMKINHKIEIIVPLLGFVLLIALGWHYLLSDIPFLQENLLLFVGIIIYLIAQMCVNVNFITAIREDDREKCFKSLMASLMLAFFALMLAIYAKKTNSQEVAVITSSDSISTLCKSPLDGMEQTQVEPAKVYSIMTSDCINVYVKAFSVDELDAKRRIFNKVLFSDIKDKCVTEGDSIIFKY